MTALWVEITGTRGSAPRNAGTAMKVTASDTAGTIGGGALEYAAIKTARAMLARGERSFCETLPLGPTLGQCCGGAVTLQYGDTPLPTDQIGFDVHPIRSHRPHPAHLWIWGAGHVGRAVVRACPPQAYKISWIDSAADRFPHQIGTNVTPVPAANMPLLATRARAFTHHLIFTYSHDIDLALCAALLKANVASIGLIGSNTKWARFQNRLRGMGLDPTQITCPIGDKSLGKMPAQIAKGTVAAMLSRTHKEEFA